MGLITLGAQDWRMGEDRLLRIRVTDNLGEDISAMTATIDLYDPDGTQELTAQAATVTPSVGGDDSVADVAYQLHADATTGDIDEAGRWRAVFLCTVGTTVQSFMVPLNVRDESEE